MVSKFNVGRNVLRVMSPITKQRLKSHVSLFTIKALPVGYQVVSEEAVTLTSLDKALRQQANDRMEINAINHPEMIYTLAVYRLDSLGNDIFGVVPLGHMSKFSAIEERSRKIAKKREVKDEMKEHKKMVKVFTLVYLTSRKIVDLSFLDCKTIDFRDFARLEG
jgi:hypothetical protein